MIMLSQPYKSEFISNGIYSLMPPRDYDDDEADDDVFGGQLEVVGVLHSVVDFVAG